jgi:RNA polymerase sigma-70 factor (sigma-E family)
MDVLSFDRPAPVGVAFKSGEQMSETVLASVGFSTGARKRRPAWTTPITNDRQDREREELTEDASVAELYRTHRLSMVRLAVLLVDDLPTAEDVVQDAFTKVHAAWNRLNDPSAAPTYLRTAVVNGSRSVLRRRRTARLFVHPRVTDEPGADAAVVLAEEHRDVLAALKRLPRRQREALVLRYWGELSEQGVAEALGISRGTVKSSTSRGLAALAQIMEAQR